MRFVFSRLTEEATKLVGKAQKIIPSSYVVNNEYLMYSYEMENGEVLIECVQNRVIRDGTVIFYMALRKESGEWVEESLWPVGTQHVVPMKT